MDHRKNRLQILSMDRLTKREIDLRMEHLVAEVAATGDRPDDGARPRWIEPAELVRRMSRYLVYN